MSAPVPLAFDRSRFTDPASAARALHAQGVHPVFVQNGGKRPLMDDWLNDPPEQVIARLESTPTANVGMMLGYPSGLLDIDLDSEWARRIMPRLLERFIEQPCPCYGRTGKPVGHYLIQAADDDSGRTTQFSLSEKETDALGVGDGKKKRRMILEVRGKGGQSVAPSSTLDSGDRVEWVRDGVVPRVPRAEVERIAALGAFLSMAAMKYPRSEGDRNEVYLSLTGALAPCAWLTDDDVDWCVAMVAEFAGDERRAGRAAETRAKIESNESVWGLPKFLELVGASSPTLEKTFRKWITWGQPQKRRSAGTNVDGFVCDDHGVPLANNQTNVRLGLERLGVTIWKNEFDDRLYIEGLEDKGFGPYIDDDTANHLRLQLDSAFRFLPQKEFFNDILKDTAHLNRRNPVAEYLDDAQAKWDGMPRLDRVLIDYFGAEDTELHRAIGPIVFMAAVRRVRNPGCQFDEILILESEQQGLNKSSAWRALAVNDRWFTDDLPLGASTKEVLEVVEGVWIAELSELKGMKRNEVEAIKAFASRREDRARLAYGRHTTYRPRRFILVGSTNDRKYLRDRTGNRRFWPVTVGTIDLDKIKADRDQLWGEAATREAAGESIRLDSRLWAEAAKAQAERETEDHPFEEAMADLLGDIERGWVWTEDLWQVLHKPTPAHRTQADNEALGGALRRLGWRRPTGGKQIRRGGRRATGFVLGPEGAASDSLPRVTFERVLRDDGSHESWRVVVEGQRADAIDSAYGSGGGA